MRYAAPADDAGTTYRVVYTYQGALCLYGDHVGSADKAFQMAVEAERELIPAIRDTIKVEMRLLSPWEDITP